MRKAMFKCFAAAVLLAAGGVAGYFAGAQDQPAPIVRTLKPNQVARVGESIITAEQLIQRLNEVEKLSYVRPDRRVEPVLDVLVAERMLELEAARIEATPKPREVQQEVDRMLAQAKALLDEENKRRAQSQAKDGKPFTPYTWAEWLQNRLQMTTAEFEDMSRIRARNDLLKRLVIWYWHGATPNIDVMLIQCEKKERIDEVQKRLAQGESFSSVAGAFSEHMTRTQEKPGLISGVYKRDGTLEPKVDDQAWALKDEATSAPFQTERGWWIVKRVCSNLVNERAFYDMRELLLAKPNVNDNMLLKWRSALASSGRYVYERRMPGWDCRADEP